MTHQKVRMFVFNNCANDARVLKESASLVRAGYEVEVVAFLDAKTEPQEVRDGVSIHRLKLNPIHLRLIRWFGNPLYFRPSWLVRRKRSRKSGRATAPKVVRKVNIIARRLRYRAIANLDLDTSDLKKAKEDLNSKFLSLLLKKPWLFFQLMVFSIGFVAVRFTYLGYRLLRLLIKRSIFLVKRTVQMVSRFLIQRPLRWMLGPVHRYFVYWDFFKRAKRYSNKFPADIYHCHDLNTLKIGIDLKKEQGAKLVYDSHELYLHKNRMRPASRLKQWVLRRIERQGMRVADRVITVGHCIADWMAEEYSSETPAVIINAPHQRTDLTVDPNISLRKELNIADDTFLLIYSGGITFNRGLENVIEAVGRVEGMHFVMLGYGTDAYLNSLRQHIRKLGLEHKVSFFGPVQHFEVASYLASADCGIAPIMNICLSYYFCSPNKLFEYVQARLPVISSNFPEMEKVVNDSQIGFTFDPEDIESIASAIRSMKDQPEKRKKFADQTHAASERYRWAVEEQKLVEIYAALG